MATLFLEMGIFTTAIVIMMKVQIHGVRNSSRDCMLFNRLLLALGLILVADTVGWLIDGHPIGGMVWITTVIDGLDLIITSYVCWCWLQYALCIADAEAQERRKWYQDFATLMLLLQVMLVLLSQPLHFYFYVDQLGFYHRSQGYFIHAAISLFLLFYSAICCIVSAIKEKSEEKRKEKWFVGLIIFLPISGNIIQLFIYGFPTVWLCMVFMVFGVYIHIQNKRMEKERQKQNEELQFALTQAQAANAAKTDFLARMSHDMRTPMNGILGLSYLMDKEDSMEQIRQEIPKIRQSGEYLLQLINDVLDVNKIESGAVEIHPKVCDEEVVFQSIIDLIEPQMEEKNIHFNFEKINIEWTYMLLDEQRVKQIFVNLLNNAIKFTDPGGKIDFVMELISEDEHMIRDRFVIRDNGIGMSEEFLPEVFTPFSQENRIHENLGGTGLGLSIVKSIVELMGGNITVKSKLNEGTEFTLYLNFPLVKDPKEIAALKSSREYYGVVQTGKEQTTSNQTECGNAKQILKKDGASGKVTGVLQNLSVLLCEDHPLNAEIATRLLTAEGAKVVWKNDGKLGYEAFMQADPRTFDIILMDIRMPNMDGIETAKAIRELDREDAKEIPIIAMTANAYEEDIEKSLAAGMNAHLSKPIQPQKMVETILKYCN